MLNSPLAAAPAKVLPQTRDDDIILYEYRHDCASGNHQLLMKVTFDGLELVCSRCRTEDKEHAKVVITWQEILAMMLLAMRIPR